jgi:hypothetical protein
VICGCPSLLGNPRDEDTFNPIVDDHFSVFPNKTTQIDILTGYPFDGRLANNKNSDRPLQEIARHNDQIWEYNLAPANSSTDSFNQQVQPTSQKHKQAHRLLDAVENILDFGKLFFYR